jgi:2'-5' RNA ligase
LNQNQETVRVFIAIEISDSIKGRIRALQQELMGCHADVGWVKPGNIHLTMRFLGDISGARIPAVGRICEEAAHGFQPFDLEVTGAGCFPNRRGPRGLWIGLGSLPESLKELHLQLEKRLALEGFPEEERPFSPHLTIGRVRSQRNAVAVAEALAARGFPEEKVQAREIVLMRSELNPGGSIYTPLGRFPFAMDSGGEKT